MTLSFTIDVWNMIYAMTLVYSIIALFLVFSTPNWPSGSVKTRGEFLATAAVALIPFLNVIIMTAQLAASGKYKWLSTWLEAPLKPGTQDVTDPEPGVESSPIIQLETNDGTKTRS
jgi:hypothetical protein